MTAPMTPERREEIRRWIDSRMKRTIDTVIGRELLAEVDRAQAVEALVTRPFGSGTVEETARWKQRNERAVIALRNVRALAMRLRKTDPENAGHLLRFCASVGVVGNVLREDVPARRRACPDDHKCRKCGETTAECFVDPDDDHQDVQYVCRSPECRHSWWIEGPDS